MSIPPIEPDPEFEQRCLTVVTSWRNGALSLERSVSELLQLLREAQKTHHVPNQARACSTLSFLYNSRGKYDAALLWTQNAERFYQEAGNMARLSGCYIVRGEIYRALGDFDQAQASYQQAYQTAQATDSLANQLFARGNAGHVALAQGHYAQARALLEEALALLAPHLDDASWFASPKAVQCEYQSALAEAYLYLGELDLSWAAAAHVHQLAKELDQMLELAIANRTIAQLLVAQPTPPAQYAQFDRDFAIYFENALTLFNRVGAEGAKAHTLLLYGQKLAARERIDTALEKFQQAIFLAQKLNLDALTQQATHLYQKLRASQTS